MALLLSFSAVLLLAVLVSSLAHRTILSTAVLFLAAGFLLGDGVLGVIHLTPTDPSVELVAVLAMFTVLFADGMRTGWGDLKSAWRLPGRALGWGLPLTLIVTALIGKYLVGLDWPEALLLGAVLAPTDPVFASAIVGNKKVPERLRHLLHVESGINDGIALPLVMLFLALSAATNAAGHSESIGELAGVLGLELGLGLAIGVVVPWVAIKLERLPFFSATTQYEPLNALAIGLGVYALSYATHANLYIAGFAAGVTVATFGQNQRDSFEHFGELIAEIMKLLALLMFGVLITPTFLGEINWTGYVFAVAAIVVARPVALWLSFLGSRLSIREQVVAMWFGPKGFPSVVLGLIVLKEGLGPGGSISDLLFHLVALTVVLSIVAHSSTDMVMARWFDVEAKTPAWHDHARKVTTKLRKRTAPSPREDDADEESDEESVTAREQN